MAFRTSCQQALATNCIHWIDKYFGECVISSAQQVGFALGLASTVIWMYAQLPQVILNMRNGSTTGLAIGFLTCLVVGDISNLVGVLITHGLATQIITATWYLIIDLVCFLQWGYYRCIKPLPRAAPDPMSLISPLPLLVAGAYAGGPGGPYDPPQLWGMLLGWVSAGCYLGSRVPQLWTNYKRKMTDGLSPQYFISAILGNTTYGASIFLQDASWGYIWGQFPWLVGSLGNLFFDAALLSQFVYYGRKRGAGGDEGAVQRLISVDSSVMGDMCSIQDPEEIEDSKRG
jgi:uncharacterized protein with PQ loop repeat